MIEQAEISAVNFRFIDIAEALYGDSADLVANEGLHIAIIVKEGARFIAQAKIVGGALDAGFIGDQGFGIIGKELGLIDRGASKKPPDLVPCEALA